MADPQLDNPQVQGNKIISLLKRQDTLLEGIQQFKEFLRSLQDNTLPDLEDSPITLIANGLSSLPDDGQKNEGLCVIYNLIVDKWRDDFVPELQHLIPVLTPFITNDGLCSTSVCSILKHAASKSDDLKTSIQNEPSLVEAICNIGTNAIRSQAQARFNEVAFMLATVFDCRQESFMNDNGQVLLKDFINMVLSVLHKVLGMMKLMPPIQVLAPLLSRGLGQGSSKSPFQDADAILTKLVEDEKRVEEIMAALHAAPESTSPVPIFKIVLRLMGTNKKVTEAFLQKNVVEGVLKWPLTDDRSTQLAFLIIYLSIDNRNKSHNLPHEMFDRAKDYLKRKSTCKNASFAALSILTKEPRNDSMNQERSVSAFAVLGKLFSEAGSIEEKCNIIQTFREYSQVCKAPELQYAWENCRDGPVLSGILDLVESGDALNDQDDMGHEDSGNDDPDLMRKKVSRLIRSNIFFFMSQLIQAKERD